MAENRTGRSCFRRRPAKPSKATTGRSDGRKEDRPLEVCVCEQSGCHTGMTWLHGDCSRRLLCAETPESRQRKPAIPADKDYAVNCSGVGQSSDVEADAHVKTFSLEIRLEISICNR